MEQTETIDEKRKLVLMNDILTPREKVVVRMRLGLPVEVQQLPMISNKNGHVWSVDEVSKLLGVTRERVRADERKAVEKLKRHKENRYI